MTAENCPDEGELATWVDAAAPPEELERTERHVAECPRCAVRASELRMLIADIAAPVPGPPLDVQQHVATVMRGLDAPQPRLRWWRVSPWSGGLGACVAAATVAVALLLRDSLVVEQPIDRTIDPTGTSGHLRARGQATEASLSRDIGVQVYVQARRHDHSVGNVVEHKHEWRPLEAGGTMPRQAALTAGIVNLAPLPAYLLLFGIDAHHTVHWIAPAFVDPSSDPSSQLIAPEPRERLLSSAVSFDDLAVGPLRLIALITTVPVRVSQVERLSTEGLSLDEIVERFPRAEVRQIRVAVEQEMP
ncbi:MAG: hypothetical protein OXU20_09200 [Myxococcales bacterium]|nr:hypothetical protein [Myxococcales bacterium]